MKSNILFLSIDSLYVDRIYGKNKSAKIPNIEKWKKYYGQNITKFDLNKLD